MPTVVRAIRRVDSSRIEAEVVRAKYGTPPDIRCSGRRPTVANVACVPQATDTIMDEPAAHEV